MLSIEKVKKILVISLILVSVSMLIRILGFIFTNNYAILIETIHMGIDVVITILILVALRIIYSKFSKKFSFGLYKLEDLISLFLGLFIIYSGIEIIIYGFTSLPFNSLYASIFQIFSIVPLIFAGEIKYRFGKVNNSPSIRSDGMHTFTDVFEGIGVALGLLLNYFTGSIYFYYFSIVLAGIALFIVSIEIIRNSILDLMDLPRDRNVLKSIENVTESFTEVKKLSGLYVRWAGSVIFVELIVEMDPSLTIEEAHPVTEKIEEKIKQMNESVISVVIHVEPSKRKNFKVIVPVKEKDINSEIHEKFSKSPYFAIVDINNGSYTVNFVENDLNIDEKNLVGVKVIKNLLKYGITDILTVNIGEIVFGLLSIHKINCWKTYGGKLNENIDRFLEGKFERYVFTDEI